jgi:hypothetical protein
VAAPAPPAGEPAAVDAPRPRVAGTADAWERCLESLARTSASLAEILRQRGRLSDLSGGRAHVLLANLREGERAQVGDARNQKLCQQAFSAALGQPLQVVLEDTAAARGTRDAFTGRVAEMFQGRTEDEG